MLSKRQRGSTWYIYGTVQRGTKKERVREYSTGETSEAAAERERIRKDAEVGARLTLGIAPPKEDAKLPFSEAVSRYVDKKHPKAGDSYRLEKLLDFFQDKPIDEIDAADWGRFCRERLNGAKANTLARYHVNLRGIFVEVGDGLALPPGIRAGGKRVEMARWLQLDVADRLIDAYAYVDPVHGRKSAQAPHAKQIALVLRFMGFRSQECLQIQRPHVDRARGKTGSIFIPPSKNGTSRWVPMHERVREALDPLLEEKRELQKITNGRVGDPLFLTDKGRPYTDTRVHGVGSNPFARAHRNACKRAGVTEFRVHDWRHHWATWFVRSGGSLVNLQRLGGWKDLSMVQRYAATDEDHAAEQLRNSQ